MTYFAVHIQFCITRVKLSNKDIKCSKIKRSKDLLLYETFPFILCFLWKQNVLKFQNWRVRDQFSYLCLASFNIQNMLYCILYNNVCCILSKEKVAKKNKQIKNELNMLNFAAY